MRTITKAALLINGVLLLFVALWLLVNSGRWGYFQANATEVDMLLLLCVSVVNVVYMGLAWLVFSKPLAPPPQADAPIGVTTQGRLPG